MTFYKMTQTAPTTIYPATRQALFNALTTNSLIRFGVVVGWLNAIEKEDNTGYTFNIRMTLRNGQSRTLFVRFNPETGGFIRFAHIN